MKTRTLITTLFVVAAICAIALGADLEILLSGKPMPVEMLVLGWIVAFTCLVAAIGCVAAAMRLARGGE